MNKKITLKTATWYGPHECQTCGKGTMIVKAGNGAPDSMQYNFTHGSNYPGHKWVKHVCITK